MHDRRRHWCNVETKASNIAHTSPRARGSNKKRCVQVNWFYSGNCPTFQFHPRMYEKQHDTQEYSGLVEQGAFFSNASSPIRGSSWNPLPFALTRLRVTCLMSITCVFIVRMS